MKTNPLLEYQNLITFLKEQTLELGVEGFWDWVAGLPETDAQLVVKVMGEPAFGLRHHQVMPRVDAQTSHGLNWRKWYLLMGRAAGKTHGASANVNLFARYLYPGCDGIMVGPTVQHVREVMIEGESGLIATAPADFVPKYQPMYSRVVWPNGSKAMIFTADNPQTIRGPSVHWGWADELAKWKSEESYLNLLSTLRNASEHGNRLIVTTSPIASKKWLRDIEAEHDCITSRATSFANSVGLDAGALAEYQRAVETGSRRAREEYLGEWLEAEDQLWTQQVIDRVTVKSSGASLADFAAEMDERLLSIDPGGKRDLTGLALIGRKGDTFWVLGDFSTAGSNEVWQQKVLEIRQDYMKEGDRVVVETNRHGDMDGDLRPLLPGIYVEGKHQPPGQGKIYRAERAYQLYERDKVRHFRVFSDLHQQMMDFYEVVASSKQSPDRVDALCTGLNWFLDRKAPSFNIINTNLRVRFDY